MKQERLIKKLQRLNLTKEEATLFLFLLTIKSATIREIHNSKEFCLKQRPNLYKTLNNLKEKNFVVEEVKGGKKRFFPIAPHMVIENYISNQEQELKKLKESAPKLSEAMENILKTPFEEFSPIPDPLIEFISGVVNEDWSIREPPEIIKKRELRAIIYSVEFNTHRQFAGNSAGLVLFIFRYQQHRDESIEEVKQYQQSQFEQALKSFNGQGFFQIEDYWVEKKFMEINDMKFDYSEFHVKSNISSDSASGIITLLFKEHPTKIISLWAADLKDFFDLITRVTKKFEVSTF